MSSPRKIPKKNVNWAKYDKKYNSAWEKDPLFSAWLTKTPDYLINEGKNEAYCKLCKQTLRPHKSDLRDHKNTAGHKQRENALPSQVQPVLDKFGFEGPKDRKEKIAELKLATVVACHSSTRAVDHIGEVVRDLGTGSTLKDIQLHRTKCSKLISKVIAPCLMQDLVDDVGKRKYAVIVDESTGVGCKKLFAMCIRYLSDKEKRMVTAFLGMVETPNAKAVTLYRKFKDFMQSVKLDLAQLEALGTDGGLNLCGGKESLYALLKKYDCPWLKLIRCVCHSLDNASSHASEEIPSSVEHLLRDSRAWFGHSALRKHEYSQLYQELCGCPPPLLVKLAETRWLAWCGAVTSHRKQYFALKTHFNMISNDPKKTCPAAKLLAELHNDDSNLLYLTFLEPVLKQVAAVNLIFQSTYADITAAYSDLRTLVLSIGERIIKPEFLKKSSQAGMIRLDELEALKAAVYKQDTWKPLDTVTFGESFRQLAESLQRDQKLTKEKITEVKVTCGKFLVRLCRELVDRLPNCVAELEKLRFFAPNRVLSKTARPAFSSLPFQSSRSDLEMLETQWSTLGALRLDDICDDEPSLDSVDIVKFWVCVGEVKNAIGKQPLKELSDAVLALLTLPLSNAYVERVFSVMGVVKNKLRNRMSLEMLNAILFLRLYLQAFGKCCRDFQPTEAMLRKFNSHTMYPSKKGKPASQAETSVPMEIVRDEAAAGDNGEEDNEDETTVDIPDDPEAIDILVSLLDEGRDVAEIIAAISSL